MSVSRVAGETPRLGQPEPLGRAPESPPKVGEPPQQLSPSIGGVAQRNDGMGVGLRHRAAVTESADLLRVGGAQSVLHRRIVAAHPARQRRTEVEG